MLCSLRALVMTVSGFFLISFPSYTSHTIWTDFRLSDLLSPQQLFLLFKFFFCFGSRLPSLFS